MATEMDAAQQTMETEVAMVAESVKVEEGPIETTTVVVTDNQEEAAEHHVVTTGTVTKTVKTTVKTIKVVGGEVDTQTQTSSETSTVVVSEDQKQQATATTEHVVVEATNQEDNDVGARVGATEHSDLTQRVQAMQGQLAQSELRERELETQLQQLNRTQHTLKMLRESSRAAEATMIVDLKKQVQQLQNQLVETRSHEKLLQERNATLEVSEKALFASQDAQRLAVDGLAAEKLALTKRVEEGDKKASTLQTELNHLSTALRDVEEVKLEYETHSRVLQSIVDDEKTANISLTEQNAQLSAELQKMRGEMESLEKNKLATAISRIGELEVALSAMQVEKTNATSEVASVKQLCDQHTKQLEEETKLSLSLSEQLAAAQAEVSKLQSHAEHALVQRNESISKLEIVQTENAAIADELHASLLSLKTEKDALASEVASMKQLCDQHSNQLEEEKKLSASLSVQLAAAQDEISNLQSHAEHAFVQRNESISKLEIAQSENAAVAEELQSSVTVLEADKAALLLELTSLKELLAKEQILRVKADEDKNRVTAQFRQLEEQVIATNESLVAANAERMKMLVQLKEATASLDTARAEMQTLYKRCEALDSERKAAEQGAQGLLDVTATHEETLRKMRASLLKSNEELKEARQNSQKWKLSAQSTTAELKERATQAEMARKQVVNLRKEIASATASIQQVTTSLKEKDKKITMLTVELAEIRSKLEATETEHASLTADNAAAIAKLNGLIKEKASLVKLGDQAATYRFVLIALIPVFIAVLVFAMSK